MKASRRYDTDIAVSDFSTGGRRPCWAAQFCVGCADWGSSAWGVIVLDDHRIDLVILTEVAEAPLRIGEHPFIITVWDISDRDYPEFPLACRDRLFERRERALLATLTRSLAVIVDSSRGAERIASLYQVYPHLIIVLPFSISSSSLRQTQHSPP
jgi:hypothetical protein